MRMIKTLISLPAPLKARLDELRAQGYTASGFVRFLLEQHFKDSGTKKKGR